MVLLIFLLPVILIGCDSSTDSGLNPTGTPTSGLTAEPTSIPAPTLDLTSLVIPTSTADASLTAIPEVLVTQTKAPSSGPKTDHYVFVTQNHPDNMKVLPGTELTITWAIKNTGTIGWTKDYSIRYFSGVSAKLDSYPFPGTVPPNGVVNLSVTFTAPKATGTYSTWWKLANPQGQNFGDVDFTFVVTTAR